MSDFTEDERAALLEPGLQVDPSAMDGGMEVNDSAPVSEDVLEAYKAEHGERVVELAYKRGWRPREEHRGNPDNWIDPVEFFDRYAETSDKRTERIADQRIAAIRETVEKRMQELSGRLDKVDEADLQATKRHYAALIADVRNDPAQVERLIEERDKAIADIEGKAAPAAPAGPAIAPETIKFFEEHPYLRDPQTADDQADRAWAAARAAELETKYPTATLEQLFTQVSHDLKQRRSPQSAPARKGRTLADDNSGPLVRSRGSTGVTPNTMSREQQAAFRQLADMGVYSDDAAGRQRYVDGLNETLAEEAARNG